MRRYDYVPNRGHSGHSRVTGVVAPTHDDGSFESAKRIREAFMDRPIEKETDLRWNWPHTMRRVGECNAVMYASEKWQKRRDHFIDYKHRAEGPQQLLVRDSFLRDYHQTEDRLAVDRGEVVDLDGPLPKRFAELAPILGIQATLYCRGEPVHYQVDIAKAMLGAGVHPGTGKTFLFVYTETEGPCCIITGEILDVEKDGIVG